MFVPVLLALSRPAMAQGTGEISANLEVSGTPACAKAPEIERRVLSRTSRIRFEPESTAARRLEVEFSKAATGIRADLEVVSTAGKHSRRSIEAENCTEAWDALGLVIALALDPGAKLDVTPSGQADDDVNASKLDSNDPPRSVRADSQGKASEPGTGAADESSRELSAASATELDAPLAPRDEGADGGSHWWLADPEIALRLGLASQITTGVAPDLMPGAAVFAGVSFDYPALVSPALFVSFARHWRSGVAADGGSADFVADLASIDACPFALHPATLALRACLALSLGRVHSEGSNTSQAESHDRPWRTAGGALLISWAPGRYLELLGAARFSAVLVRDRYQFAPNVFHEAPETALAGTLGAAFRFP